MELIKKINNNFAVARDSDGTIVIVTGRGIGFEKMPSVVKDLSKITRTYYDVDERYINLVKTIPEDTIMLANKIVDHASRKLHQKLNPNLFFTLADHIDFAIKRARQGITFHFGVTYEIKYLHPNEMQIGIEALTLINKRYQVQLPEDEASVIAMHILESENFTEEKALAVDIDVLMKEIREILAYQLNITIDQNSFHYCRFVTHVQYLLKRKKEQSEIISDNSKLYQSMIEAFPAIYQCVVGIRDYLYQTISWSISDEEMLYLMLHINRLCNNEDCNR